MAQGAAREHLPYVNFEDERLAELKAGQLGFQDGASEQIVRTVTESSRRTME